jgi:hypothetical protein
VRRASGWKPRLARVVTPSPAGSERLSCEYHRG